MQDIQAIDVIQFITNNDLKLYKTKNSNASLQEQAAYKQESKKGVVFASYSKEDLKQGKGFVATSYETLAEQYNKLSHFTPNTYRGGTYYDFKKRIIKGHEKKNLKQINTIGIDIDTKNVDLYAIFMRCNELDLPFPNVILSTPRGYQAFFVLETPFFIHRNEDYKAMRIAERTADNVITALQQDISEIDLNCNKFSFFRVPNDKNIIYFNDEKINTADLMKWSKNYERQQQKNQFSVFSGGRALARVTASAWYKKLLEATHIQKGEYAASRNNALLTLALANYEDNISFDVAYNALDQWNSNLYTPLSKREFNKTMQSAYSGRYKGVKRSYAENLLEQWTDNTVSYSSNVNGWYKFAKPREERKRSHYYEYEQDIIQYIKQHANEKMPYIKISLRLLADTLQIPLSSLKAVLKNTKNIHKKTDGKGRSATTYFTTKSLLFNHLIKIKKEKINIVQNLFSMIFPNTKSLPTINFNDKYHEEIISDTS